MYTDSSVHLHALSLFFVPRSLGPSLLHLSLPPRSPALTLNLDLSYSTSCPQAVHIIVAQKHSEPPQAQSIATPAFCRCHCALSLHLSSAATPLITLTDSTLPGRPAATVAGAGVRRAGIYALIACSGDTSAMPAAHICNHICAKLRARPHLSRPSGSGREGLLVLLMRL